MNELADRIREVRISTSGLRGQADFARNLGISPSTYNYYERGRLPPLPVLVRISEVGGVDLRWLLTGRLDKGEAEGAVSPDHARILTRLASLLPRRSGAEAALSALLDLLEAQPDQAATPPGKKQRAEEQIDDEEEQIDDEDVQASRIPVLGRSAAGVPQFWKKRTRSADLYQSIMQHSQQTGPSHAAAISDPEGLRPSEIDQRVQLIQLNEPVLVGELSITEFVECSGLSIHQPEAFALRIDGDSMHPSLSHGDLVVLSPSRPAKEGRMAVVQLRNQIGVTCKLFYTDKTHVHLIPINEQFQATKLPLKDMKWALAVLHRIRLV